MRKEKKTKQNKRNGKKLVNYIIEACRRMLIRTPLYQVGAGTLVEVQVSVLLLNFYIKSKIKAISYSNRDHLY
jgi:hypothetical protein